MTTEMNRAVRMVLRIVEDLRCERKLGRNDCLRLVSMCKYDKNGVVTSSVVNAVTARLAAWADAPRITPLDNIGWIDICVDSLHVYATWGRRVFSACLFNDVW